MQVRNELAIVGVFFDGYEEFWYDFFNLFFKNWEDCPYDIYIVNNTKNIKDDYIYRDRIHVIHAGADAEYSRKLHVAAEEIQADYYLFVLEDFFICKKIKTEMIGQILSMIIEDNIDYYEMPLPEFAGYDGKNYKDNNAIYEIGTDKTMLFSCQPAIWRKEFLQFILGDGDYNFNAWVFEGMFVVSETLRNDGILKYAVYDKRNPLEMVHGAYQGKVLRDAIMKTRECGYEMTNTFPKMKGKVLFKYKMKRSILKMLRFLGLYELRKIYKDSVTNRYKEQSMKFAQTLYFKEKVEMYMNKKEVENT